MINLNQYTVSPEYRIENESTVYSFEPGFLNDIDRVWSLYEEDEREREREKERRH